MTHVHRYWNVPNQSGGVGNVTLDDYVPFGKWREAVMKQYSQEYPLCGLSVDLDCYIVGKHNNGAYRRVIRSVHNN
jgi:hypothetical protein